jgi:hypothetical protein
MDLNSPAQSLGSEGELNTSGALFLKSLTSAQCCIENYVASFPKFLQRHSVLGRSCCIGLPFPSSSVSGGPPRETPSASGTGRGRGKHRGASSSAAGPCRPTKSRKERDPTWAFSEMMALVIAKRDEFVDELDVVDQ